jgi:hypothetical protein
MPGKPGRRPLSGYTIEEAAYHEAAQAVLALACQAAVRSATIKPHRHRRGRAIFDSHLVPRASLLRTQPPGRFPKPWFRLRLTRTRCRVLA